MRGEKQFQDRFREIFDSDLIAVPNLVTADASEGRVVEIEKARRSRKSLDG